MQSWGWRVPFLLAAPLGVVGLYMRLKLNETPVYREMAKTEAQHGTPLVSAFKTQKANMVLAFFCSSIMGVGLYYFATYFVNALSLAGALTRPSILTVSAVALLIYAVLCPVAGWISDNIGRRPVYLAGCVGHLVLAVPIFKLVTSGNTSAALLGLAIFAIPQAALNVMGSITLVELFPPHNRSTGAAIGYGLGVGPIAGSAPLIATALVEHTGNPMVAAYYLMGIALVVTVVLVARLPETFTRSLFASTPARVSVDERGTEPSSDEAAMA
jgi:MHS family proline/betaine transporter-like MFS transporter